jgi:hypothetical protein
MNENLLNVMMTKGRPIPGQSLTTDPSNPAPYEKAPEFTTVYEASEDIFARLLDEERYMQTMTALADGIPIMDLVQGILFKGFTEGKWNPDLMLLLAEPIAYMFLALAERAGIDPVIYRGEEDDEIEEERVLGVSFEKEKLERMKKTSEGKAPIPADVVTKEMQEKIEALPDFEAPSLLAPPETEQTEEVVE